MEHAGTWEFPGGKVEAGEADSLALMREIAEELDWTIAVGERVGEGTTGHVHLIAYACIATGEPTLIEHDESRWIVPNEFAGLRWAPADGPILEALRAREKALFNVR